MKRQTKWMVMIGILVLGMNVLPYVAKAQLGNPEGDPDAPIDGGVSLLIAAGVGYGIKKNRENKKKKETHID
jgi:hypothetical protein